MILIESDVPKRQNEPISSQEYNQYKIWIELE